MHRSKKRPVHRSGPGVGTGAGGVEPPTTRLTVERSAIELHPKKATTPTGSTGSRRHCTNNRTERGRKPVGRENRAGQAPSHAMRPRSHEAAGGGRVYRRVQSRALHSSAQARDRTEMPLRARDFESRASASSATWARRVVLLPRAERASVLGHTVRRHRGTRSAFRR